MLTSSAVQMLMLLLFVRYVAPCLMSRSVDSDNYMTPLVTALGDLIGTLTIDMLFAFLVPVSAMSKNQTIAAT